jgi:chromosome segregation ATPase
MDERKKTIREMEEKRQEDLQAIDLILEDLGKNLLLRLDGRIDAPDPLSGAGEGPSSRGDLSEYRRILKEIGDSEVYIQSIEADSLRLKELEEDISKKEQCNAEDAKELSQLYTRLGELLMEDPGFSDFTGPFRRQIETLVPKIKSLEDRLEELEDGDRNNVFTWIGKSAQGMVIRSFLGKNQGNLQRIYLAVGEQFSSAGFQEPIGNPGILSVLGEIEGIRKRILERNEALNVLRNERRKIGDAFSAEGGPVKRTQSLERHILHFREKLRSLYLRYGERIAGGALEEESAPLLTDDDRLLLDKITQLRNAIEEYDKSIDKLKASLAIDAERAEIAKMEKSIEAHKQRIAVSSEAIRDLERHIAESNRRIHELMEV